MEGSALTIIYDAGIAILAVMAIAAASTGYLLSRLDWIQRIALYTVAALLFYTAAWSDIVGAALLLGITTFSYWQGRRQTVPQVG